MESSQIKNNKWFGIPRSSIDWYPTIDKNKCITCLICVKFCKKGVFTVSENKPKVINPKNCVVGCRGCDAKCPVGAISHPSDEYLSELLKQKSENAVGDCCSTCAIK
ncbi:MAG: ferredoxin family protein [Candidatus Moranbacteria bacterium]|nr:ferredoxin family protein [Candidatus Moranbacteria bacterium]